MDVSVFLLVLGGVVLIGVLGNYFFSRTKIPTPVILMIAGILLGPVTGFMQHRVFMTAAPYFGAVALILILFEGGLDLEFKVVLRQVRTAIPLGIVYFAACVLIVYSICRFLIGMDPRASILGGFILGGTSPSVLLPVISQLSISKETKTLLTIETAFTEVLTVITVVLDLDLIESSRQMNVLAAGSHLVWTVVLSFFLAGFTGLLWGRVVPIVVKEQLSYMLTLAVVFLLYGVASWLGAEPALTILFFGMFLANARWIIGRFRRIAEQSKWQTRLEASDFEVHETLKTIYAELGFLVRTFFFVFMGLLFEFKALTPQLWAGTGAILAGVVVARFVLVQAGGLIAPALRGAGSSSGVAMLPRGLACAVVALFAAQKGIEGTASLLQLSFLVILGTNLVMTVLVFRHQTLHPEAVSHTSIGGEYPELPQGRI